MHQEQVREQRLRLEELYRAMGDGELLELASQPEDLTDTASEVLGAEMERRGLDPPHPPVPAEEEDAEEPVVMPAAGDLMPENLGAFGPEIELSTFHDALAARRACELLEQAGIPFHVADVSGPREGLRSFDGGPPVSLRITVSLEELQQAQAVLRNGMGLFPLENIAEPDEPLDDGTRSPVGMFATRAEAEEIAGVLTAAGIWNQVVEDAEDLDTPFAVEVREVDLFAAGDAVEKALEG